MGPNLVEKNQLLKDLYVWLPSLVLGIISIGQVLVGSCQDKVTVGY